MSSNHTPITFTNVSIKPFTTFAIWWQAGQAYWSTMNLFYTTSVLLWQNALGGRWFGGNKL